MFDIIIRNGLAVLPGGARHADIAITSDKIVAIGDVGGFSTLEATRAIDATGKIVIPGGVDPHIHCSSSNPGPGGVPITGADPEEVSRACLYGGTTTMCDFAFWNPGETLAQTMAKRHAVFDGKCFSDYTLHIAIESPFPRHVLDELAGLVADGYPTVKMYTTDITPNRMVHLTHFGDIWEVLKVLAKAGGLALIHAEDNDLVMHMYEKLFSEDRVDFENMAEVHTTLSEELSFNRAIGLAENVPGAAVYMVHTTAKTGVESIRRSRAKGFPIYGEVLHQYLLFTAQDYKRPDGQIYHTYPALKFPEDQRALWEGMETGDIQCVATDEVCCPLEIKLLGRRIDDTTGGNCGVEPRISLMYTQMVTKRGYSLERFVDLVSTNASKILGLYPRKGVLAVGSDADIVLLDPALAHTIDGKALHSSNYSPWDGWDVSVWPSLTILRGRVVVESGRFLGGIDDGRFIKRTISPEILKGPYV